MGSADWWCPGYRSVDGDCNTVFSTAITNTTGEWILYDVLSDTVPVAGVDIYPGEDDSAMALFTVDCSSDGSFWYQVGSFESTFKSLLPSHESCDYMPFERFTFHPTRA
eukprot:6958193-Pyramimonas_sp.AAC.1